MITNFISSIDFLSSVESIKFNKSPKFQSFFGGLISLIVILFSLAMSIYISLGILLKNAPNSNHSIELSDNLEDYFFSNNGIEFFFALKFANSTPYIDSRIFTARALQIETYNIINENGVETSTHEKSIDLKLCSEIYNKTEASYLNVIFPFEKYFCIPSNVAKLNGNRGSKISNIVKIYIEKCSNITQSDILTTTSNDIIKENNSQNSKENEIYINKLNNKSYQNFTVNNQIDKNICLPIEEINQILSQGFINIMTSDYLVNENNFDQPLTKYLNDISDIIIGGNTSLDYYINYNKLKFQDDNGLILEDIQTKDVLKIFNIKNIFYYKSSNIIASIQFEITTQMNKIFRTYPKIQEILTKIGGFINAINILGFLLYYLYYKAFRIIDLVIENHFGAFEFTIKSSNLKKVSEFIQNSKYNYFISEYNKNLDNRKNYGNEKIDKIVSYQNIDNNFANKNSSEKEPMIYNEMHYKIGFETDKLDKNSINNENVNKPLLNNNIKISDQLKENKNINYNNNLKTPENYMPTKFILVSNSKIKENKICRNLNIENLKNLKSFDLTKKNEIGIEFNNYDDEKEKSQEKSNFLKERMNHNSLNHNKLNEIVTNKNNKIEKENSIDYFKNDFKKRNKKLRFRDNFPLKKDFLSNKIDSINELQIDKNYRERGNFEHFSKQFTIKNDPSFCKINDKIKGENENFNKNINCNDVKNIKNNILELSVNHHHNESEFDSPVIYGYECEKNTQKNIEFICKNNINYNKKFNIPEDSPDLVNNFKNFEIEKHIKKKSSKNKENLNNASNKSFRNSIRKIGTSFLTSKDVKFRIKKDLFFNYWCYKKDNKLKKILQNKEEIINYYLSIENLTKISFDVKYLKYLYLDKENLDLIDQFYKYSIIDHDNIDKLKFLILGENFEFKKTISQEYRNIDPSNRETLKKEKIRLINELLKLE